MHPIKAEFVKSTPKVEDCPKPSFPEYAFIGRSNVGKSSLINMLTGNKKLAKTSSTPGKTQLINHFLIEDSWYLVDLPGYGFAKVPLKEKAKWEKMTWDYLEQRENLLYVFVLIDSRIPPQKIDLEFVNKLGEKEIPLKLIFTKWDKVKPMKGQKNINDFKMALAERWAILPEHYVTSSEKGLGRLEVLQLVDEINASHS
ncbi:ribosome biogenesis GTP-binding protein YihA/YsxC [Jiulongibacter sediminis]|uniref:Probable GTP-binding protein EngB n=1 Tax=Jiulongibacter sediminis TaxID=1605367 RepID=A0A0P7BCK2_9BACT|nr:ribosome biogenesis GTP-binding protein YihA/YsxC [Jiulongibacter sediminis]KPM48320.1 GTP-binding protein [Jiulongibacter sediminis]TBX24857.1 GTP-binding protein [Jiulongibacter sediminis]